jgi:hypothetical protein
MMDMSKKLVWNNCKKIGEVKKSDRTKVVVELVARDGIKYINIRGWYIRKRDNEWRPALDGIAIPIDIPIDGKLARPIVDIMKMINTALDMAEEFPIEDEANAVWAEDKKKE